MKRNKRLCCALAVGGAVLATDAHMAAQAQQLEEILVTARRRSENLQDVPLTVTAFTGTEIERRGINNIDDVARLTPGLVIDKGFVTQDVRPTIRGLPSTRGRPPVGILLDGIDISTESIATAGGGNLMNLRLADFERIEVVKGPQSALYGRVAFGGAINYITRDPTDEFTGYVQAETATDGLNEFRGAISGAVNDRLALRLNAAYAEFDGFYENEISGETIGGYESIGAALSARLKIGDNSRIIARISYTDDESEQRPASYNGSANGQSRQNPLPAAALGALGLPPGTSWIGLPPGDLPDAGAVRLSLDPATGAEYDPAATNEPLIANVRGEFDLGFANLNTWTGYVSADSTNRQDADFFGYPLQPVALPVPGLGEPPTGIFLFDTETETRQFSQEIRLSDLEAETFRWAVGALYWTEEVEQENRSYASFGIPFPIFAPSTVSTWLNASLQGGRPAQGTRQDRDTDHLSAYALLEYSITPRLEVSAEVRFAREEYDYTFGPAITTAPVPDPVTGLYPFTFAPGDPQAADAKTTYVAPRFAIQYEPKDDLLLYASAARGVKPAGITQVAGSNNPEEGAFDEEFLWNYEAGFKSTLMDGRVQFNAAAFRMEYTDKQVSTLRPVSPEINPQGTITVIENIGEAVVNGAELGLAWLPFPDLNVSVNYTYLDTEYTDFTVFSSSPLGIGLAGNCDPTTITTGTGATLNGCNVTSDGAELEQAPTHSVVGTIAYNRQLTGGLDLLAEMTVQHTGERYLDNFNRYRHDDFTLVDLRLGVTAENYSIILYGDNVFDNDTVRSAQLSGDNLGGFPVGLSTTVYSPDKAQWGIRLRYEF